MAFECMFGRVSKNYYFIIYRDLMLEKVEKKSEIIFFLNKFKLREMKFLEGGLLKLLTGLIR